MRNGFPCLVQVQQTGGWVTLAMCIDERTAEILAYEIRKEGERVRVKCGTKVVSDVQFVSGKGRYSP